MQELVYIFLLIVYNWSQITKIMDLVLLWIEKHTNNVFLSKLIFTFSSSDMQIVLWVAIPSLLEKGSITLVMTVFLIMFLFQYLPKIYHSVCLLRRMQNLSGYIFGTVWWGIALNMIAYFVASHVSLMHLNFFSCNVYLYIVCIYYQPMPLFFSFFFLFNCFC